MSTESYNSRYFNNFVIGKKVVFKASVDIKKLSSEFYQYRFMPKELKKFFVKPKQLKINGGYAVYKMKKISSPDFGKLFTSSNLDNTEFSFALSAIFDFLSKTKKYNKDIDTRQQSKELVLDKTLRRIRDFKKVSDSVILNSKMDTLFFRLYRAYMFYSAERPIWQSSASHGDLCFSNILWDNKSKKIYLIDPRGALRQEDIYLDEYYDLAKLSHSILGNYDFVVLDRPLTDTKPKQELFKTYLINNNVSYNFLRVYEASLFLSMIPLHIENMNHIKQFIQACDKILSEIGF